MASVLFLLVRNHAIPRNLELEGFRVKVSYYGRLSVTFVSVWVMLSGIVR